MLESLFDNVAELQPCNLFKETPTQVFSCEVWEIFRTLEESLRTTACVTFFQLCSECENIIFDVAC